MDVHKSTIVNAVVPKYFLSVAFPNSRDLIQAVLLMKQFDSSLDIFVQKSDYSFRQALDILRKIAECVREFQLNWRTHGKLHAGNVFLRQAEGAIEVRIGYVGLLETLETKTIPSAKCLPGQFAVNDERIDLSTDVNGFGILIWQVLTRQPGGAVVQDRAEMRTDCTRLIDAYCSACGDSVFGSFPKSEALEGILQLMLKCQFFEIHSFDDICFSLESLADRHSPSDRGYLDCRPRVQCGEGLYVFPNGDLYEGQFRHFNFSGDGTLWLSSGDVYTGRWKLGKPHGFGTLEYGCGDLYSGIWKRGERQGHGCLHFHNGDVMIGTWRDEAFEVQVYYAADGELIEMD
eukprot:TRINITY_DN14693_c0_g1_i1.p1 TRINITY_DN14693_c0_g1~~TRINITY_DN14693_c0_g1_i1.p1  ORF type:complete len:357 (-),score=71.67 TRINITY_DN14693_c0_g1_i1:180-1217(-)